MREAVYAPFPLVEPVVPGDQSCRCWFYAKPLMRQRRWGAYIQANVAGGTPGARLQDFSGVRWAQHKLPGSDMCRLPPVYAPERHTLEPCYVGVARFRSRPAQYDSREF